MKSNRFAGEHTVVAGQYTKERDYWLLTFSGDWTRGRFPGDSGIKESPVSTVTLRFPDTVPPLLTALSGGSEPRLHMILTAGLTALLNRYTGETDITVGTVIYKPETEGEFVNTILPLRNPIEENMSFKDLLIQTRRVLLEAAQNVNYPMERLLYELNMPLSEDRFPLFDIAVLLENIHDRKHLMDINIDMIFTFRGSGETLDAAIEFKTSVYKQETVESIFNHFARLLHHALTRVDTPLAEIDILSGEEKEHLLFDFNRTGATYPKEKPIHLLFEEQVERTPAHIAVEGTGEGTRFVSPLSYRELNEAANRLARVLRAGTVRPGTLAALMADHSVEVVIAILAILKAGGAYLPLDPEYPVERLRYIVKSSDAGLLLTFARNSPAEEIAFKGEVLDLADEGLYTGGHGENLENVNGPCDPAYVIFTSGSTGKPKGVVVEHRGLVNYIKWAEKVYLTGEKTTFPLYSSLAFDLTVTSIYLPLISGNTIRVYSVDENEDVIAKIVGEDRVHIVKLTPTHLKIIKDLGIDQSNIRALIVGGEELTTESALDIHREFKGAVAIYNEYGPTETVVGCMSHRFDPLEDQGKSVSIGTPADNTQVYILDAYRNPVPPGAIGELYIAGDGVARGYLNNPGLTAERFNRSYKTYKSYRTDVFYKTGDLARWRLHGGIEFLGRTDRQVKIRGYRIELGEIESKLLTHPDVNEAAAVIETDKAGDPYICAYVTLSTDPGTPFEKTGLEEHLAGGLPDYMIPSYLTRLDAMPLTPNGKLDAKRLPGPGKQAAAEYVPPRDGVEEKMAAIWADILGVEKNTVGINDNFFKMGGHSLRATRLAVRIHKEFNVKVPLLEVFKTPTVRGLAEYVKQTGESRWTSIPPAEKKEYYALSSAQKRLYLLQQVDTRSTAYNIPMFIPLHMDTHTGGDKGKLEQTFNRLIQRHESLRTSFLMRKEDPVQKIHPGVEFEIEDIAIPGGPVDKRRLAADILRAFIRPFDLARAPLMRVGLVSLEENEYLLLVDMHHIVTDGISHPLMKWEFNEIFGGEEPPPPPLQYKDFAEWQNRELEAGEFKKQEEYWLERFNGHIPVLNLPVDFPRTEETGRMGWVYFSIDKELTLEVKKRVLETGSTVFIFLLAVYTLLLSKYTNQEDIVVGCPIAGRTHQDLNGIIGMFVNLLALRNFPEPGKTVDAFLEEVKENAVKGFENQDYQFEELVSKLSIPRQLNRNPLSDTVFVMEQETGGGRPHSREDEPDEPEPGNEDRYRNFNVAKFDITLGAVETEAGISIDLGYRERLFKRETMERMGRHFLNIVKETVESPHKEISRINMLGTAKKEEIKKTKKKMEAAFDF